MRRQYTTSLTLILLLSVLVVPGLARAADVTEVTTAFEKGNPYDFRFKVSYDMFYQRSALNREYMGNAAGIDIVKDLIFKQVTHQLNLRAEFADYSLSRSTLARRARVGARPMTWRRSPV